MTLATDGWSIAKTGKAVVVAAGQEVRLGAATAGTKGEGGGEVRLVQPKFAG